MSRVNPMLKALDGKIADLQAKKAQLDTQIVTLEGTRRELEGLVRRRRAAKARTTVPANDSTATPA